MEAHTIRVHKTAHYYTLGQPGTHTRFFWIACHGYGQAAKNFIRKFESIQQPDTFILAPEGLSRFYWKGFNGEVGASWMTREDRLLEIDDYCDYLSSLYRHYLAILPEDVTVILMGFSQGCATQMRWMMRDQPAFRHLVLWAGSIPEDIDYQPQADYLNSGDIHFVYGSEDEFLTPERMEQFFEAAVHYPFHLDVSSFEGKHEVDRTELEKLDERIRLKALT
ncbi:MAG: phospholipase [Saprospiraceae bacterium]|nr:phospholipase [Saprospiraceae bacterium]